MKHASGKNLKKYILKTFLKNLFFLYGITETDTNNPNIIMKVFYFVILPSVIAFITFGRTVSFINITIPVVKLEAGLNTFFSYGVIAWFVYFNIIRKHLIEIYSAFDENSPNYLGEEGMETVRQRFYTCFKWNSQVFGFTMVLHWMATVIIEEPDINVNHHYMHLYSCGSMENQSTIPFCMKQGSKLHNLVNKILDPLLYGIQVGMIMVVWLGYITITDTIEARLTLYGNKLDAFIDKYKTGRFTKQHRAEFYSIIRYQQDILAKSRKIIKIINMPMAGHVIMLYFYNLFGILPLTHPELRTTYAFLRLPVPTFYSIYIHYSCCDKTYINGHIHDTILDKLLKLPWYDRNLSFQKCYLNLMVITQKNHPLYICGLYEMDLIFFSANMKRLYTLINILLLKFKL